MWWSRVRKNFGYILAGLVLLSILIVFQSTLQSSDNNPTIYALQKYPSQQQRQLKQQSQPKPSNYLAAPQSTTIFQESKKNKECVFTKNIAFIKTHKAGSSTIANILQRFGLNHNLTFALPNKPSNVIAFNYIVKPGQVFTREKLLPLPIGHEYNILWCHSIYNRTAFKSIMPESTAYISILREPFQQFVSSFEYYGVAKSILKLNVTSNLTNINPESEYLNNPRLARLRPMNYGYTRNKQAQDLGFGINEFYLVDKMHEYINQLDKDFTSIMIMEYFDESLLLLRHKLCWGIADILYIPKNKNRNKPIRHFTEADKLTHERFSHVDYQLYHYFLERFKREIRQQAADFFEELEYFKSLLKLVFDNCSLNPPKSFFVPRSQWNTDFNVTVADCEMMVVSELRGLIKLRKGLV